MVVEQPGLALMLRQARLRATAPRIAVLTAAADSGYEIDETEVIYWGRCPACVVATKETARKGQDRRD